LIIYAIRDKFAVKTSLAVSSFEVKALHLEPGAVVDDALVAEVKSALQACARFAHRTGAGAV
jgi:hypothetical protein